MGKSFNTGNLTNIIGYGGSNVAITGSVNISGTVVSTGTSLVSGSGQISYTGITNIPSGIVSGSAQILNGSGIWSGSAQLPSGVVSGSAQTIANLPSGVVSGSAQVTTLGFASTGSNSFQGTQTVNGSLVVTGSITAQQYIVSSSVTYLTESFSSGSTKFGDSSDDNHNFTGSVLISGSLTSTSNVIIGASSTSSKLSVFGNEIGSQITFTKDAPNSVYGRLGQDSNGTFLTQNANYNGSVWNRDYTTSPAMALSLHNGNSKYEFRIASAGTNPITWNNAMTLDTSANLYVSGSVGIGKSSPTCKLDISGSHTGGYGILNITSNDSAIISLDSTTSSDVRLRFKSLGVDKWFAGMNVSDNFELRIGDNSAKFTITQGGAATFSNTITSQANGSTFGTASSSGRSVVIQAGSANQVIQFKNAAGGDGTLYVEGNSTAAHYRFDTYSTSNALFIANGGNIGIATNNPSAKLNSFIANDLTTVQLRAETDTSSVVSYVGLAPSIIEYYRGIATGVDLTIQTKIDSAGSGGAIVFAPNSNTSSYTPVERMKIRKDGIVTIPYQPAFYAFGVAGGSYVSGSYWIFPSTAINRGGYYNTSNGIFTAPVSGAYYFAFSNIMGQNATVYRWYLRVNNSDTGTGATDVQLRMDRTSYSVGTSYGWNMSRSVIINLAAGDTVRIYSSADDSSNLYPGGNDSTNSYPNFMGHLIG